MADERAWRVSGAGLAVRLTRRASHDALAGPVAFPDGAALKASVTAPPADNAANTALVKLMSRTWRIPKTTMTISAGARARTETVTIADDARAGCAA